MMQSIDQPMSGVVTMKRASSTPSSSSTQQIHYKLIKHSQDVKKSAFLSWKKVPLSLFSHPNTLAIMKKKDPVNSRKSTLMLDAQYTQVKMITNESMNKKHPFCFSIKSHIEGKNKEEEWMFECSSRAECEDWVESIKRLLNRGVGGGGTSSSQLMLQNMTSVDVNILTSHTVEQVLVVVPEQQHQQSSVIQSASSAHPQPITKDSHPPKEEEDKEPNQKIGLSSHTSTSPPQTTKPETTTTSIPPLHASTSSLEELQPAKLDDTLVDDELEPIEPAKLDDVEEEPVFVLQNAVIKRVEDDNAADDHLHHEEEEKKKNMTIQNNSQVGKKKTTILKDEESSDEDIIVTSKKKTSATTSPPTESTNPRATSNNSFSSAKTTNSSNATTTRKHQSSASLGGPPNKAKKTVLKDDDSSSDEEEKDDIKVVNKKNTSSTTPSPSSSGGPPNKSKKTVLKDESDDDDEPPNKITSSGAPPKRTTTSLPKEETKKEEQEEEDDVNKTIIRKAPSSQNASSNSLKSGTTDSIVEVTMMDPLFELSEDEKDEEDDRNNDDDEDYEMDNEVGDPISSLSQLIEELEYNSNCRAKAMKCAKYLHSHFVKNKKQLIDDILKHEGLQSCICMINDNTKSYSIAFTGLSICVEVIESTAPNNEQHKALMKLTGCMGACIDIVKRHHCKFLKRMTAASNKINTTTHVEHVRVMSLAVQLLSMLSEKPSDHVNELLAELEKVIKQCDEVISKVYALKQLTLSYELSRNMFILLNNISLHNIESLKTISKKQGAFDMMIKFVVYHYGVSIPNKINNDDENAIIIPLTKFVSLTAKDTSKMAKMELAKSMVMQGGVSSLLSPPSTATKQNSKSSNIQQYITKIFLELSDASPLIMKSFKNIVLLNLKNKELVTNTLNVMHTIYRNKSDSDAREKLIQVLATEFGSLFFAALSKYADDGWVVSFCVEFLFEIEKCYPSVLAKAWGETSTDSKISQTVYTHVRTLVLSLNEFNDNELYEMMMSLFLKHLENDPNSAGAQFAGTFGFHVALLDIIQRSTTPHILTLTLHVLSLVIPYTQFKMKRSSIDKDNLNQVENILSKDIREKLIASSFSKLKDATNMEKEGCIFLFSILQGIAQYYEAFKVSMDDMKSLVKYTQIFTHSDNDGELSLSLLKLVAKLNEMDSNGMILQKSGCIDLCKKLVQLHSDSNKELKEFAKNELSTLL